MATCFGLQPSSGQHVVQIRYNYCAYDMGSHKVYMCSTREIKHSMKPCTVYLNVKASQSVLSHFYYTCKPYGIQYRTRNNCT